MAIATNVTLICDSNPNNSHLKNFTKIQERLIYTKKIIIESDCWIGANATILGGVKIGQYSIVGAGSVVTTDVDSYSIYAGVPARKLRSIR
ncbi:acyltransferase [Helicobacter pullorum]|uniref:acyltransferase n=1 Tax=Helicobacter pullorum TaxID=35818 RepID=UPI0001979164|nr:acyltransferase [Helicobacter pullorum]